MRGLEEGELYAGRGVSKKSWGGREETHLGKVRFNALLQLVNVVDSEDGLSVEKVA